MKLLIAVDMEGITGVCTWDHVTPGHAEYERFRRQMTADVNAAVEGASQAGFDDIVVTDGHWNGSNILVEQLDPRARLNSGSPSPFSMVQGASAGADAAFFIGYHARAGSWNAVLDHTWSAARVANFWINDRITGETGLNGALCGHFGIPVVMVSGDQTVAAEACEWIDGVETAIVKKACGRYSAELLNPEQTHKIITATALRAGRAVASGKAPAPIKVTTPVTLRVEFFHSNMADSAVLAPGARRIDGRKIEIEAADMAAAYLAFRALVSLAPTA
jgi:D-amino peptidase